MVTSDQGAYRRRSKRREARDGGSEKRRGAGAPEAQLVTRHESRVTAPTARLLHHSPVTGYRSPSFVICAGLLSAALPPAGRHGRGHLAPTVRLRRGEPFGQ